MAMHRPQALTPGRHPATGPLSDCNRRSFNLPVSLWQSGLARRGRAGSHHDCAQLSIATLARRLQRVLHPTSSERAADAPGSQATRHDVTRAAPRKARQGAQTRQGCSVARRRRRRWRRNKRCSIRCAPQRRADTLWYQSNLRRLRFRPPARPSASPLARAWRRHASASARMWAATRVCARMSLVECA